MHVYWGVGNEWIVSELTDAQKMALNECILCRINSSKKQMSMFGYAIETIDNRQKLIEPPQNVQRIARALGAFHEGKKRLAAIPFLINADSEKIKKELLLLKRKIRKYYGYGNGMFANDKWDRTCQEWYVRTVARKHKVAQKNIRSKWSKTTFHSNVKRR
ncbi:MAG: hypothetical protein ACRC5C_00460 [Bacilli bacterium]